MKQRKPLTWRGKLLMTILSPIVVLGIVELGLRIGGFRFEPWKAQLEGRTHAELGQKEFYAAEADLLWTLRPSTVLHHETAGFIRVRTNAHGLRGRELPGPKEKGEVRVLVLGDSVCFGLGLLDAETWPARMEEVLREAPELSGRKVRVINGAVPGYSSVQGMRLVEKLRDLEPDVIVFSFGFADANPMRGLPDSALTFPAEGVPKALTVLWKLRVFQLVQSVVTGLRKGAAEDATRVSRAEYRANVGSLLERERSGGPRVLFLRESDRLDLARTQLERVVARAEEVGVDVVLGPYELLLWTTPAREGADLRGTMLRNGRAIFFQPDRIAEMKRTLDEIRADIETLRQRKRDLDRLQAELPEDCLDYEDLFGAAPPSEIFYDNCHMTPHGAILAGRSMAKAVLEALRDEQDR